MHAFRISFGIHHFALYGLYRIFQKHFDKQKIYRMSLYIYIADDPQSHTNFIETPPNEYLKGFRIMNQGNQGMKPRKVFFNAVKVDCS